MSDYKTIHGTTVKSYTTDPDPIIEGQVWYDKTNKVLQFEIPNITSAGAWRSAADLNTARGDGGGAGVSSDAALAFGGEIAPPTAITESYNGVTWTEVGDMNTARYENAGVGTYTAALTYGGNPGTLTENELWNGSAWTEVGDLNSGRGISGNAGTSTSALGYGGRLGTTNQATNESWNGSSWTEVGDLNTARARVGGAGSSNTNAI